MTDFVAVICDYVSGDSNGGLGPGLGLESLAATLACGHAAADFTPSGGRFDNVIHLTDRQPIELGPFLITPYLMDDSAYDAYAVLVTPVTTRLHSRDCFGALLDMTSSSVTVDSTFCLHGG